MKIHEAAILWGMSPNWVRVLVRRGVVRAEVRTNGGRAWYEIPDSEPRPELPRGRPPRRQSR